VFELSGEVRLFFGHVKHRDPMISIVKKKNVVFFAVLSFSLTSSTVTPYNFVAKIFLSKNAVHRRLQIMAHRRIAM